MKIPVLTLALIVLSVCLIPLPNTAAQAGMISTQDVLSEQNTQANRDKVSEFLNRASVQEKLQVMDVPAALASSRVDALTPAEVATLAQRIDALPAAGALSGNDVIIILLVALLVVLIL
ncbi:PA2779 family protein [Pseudomonas sp. UBA2684]|uniref:PA2779 family protein n=1 Tax=Pseudomonas sp. UBA2684 TaxID=1947311 RepID=UPI000E7EF33D|nr:PA2779 family protein [Pseudomonas sp. UBA2684]HBX55986.1 hypothetical protein [Pseudomonas sp.]|tara:strand:+ start:4671 stop:5027 length:357 start_codon:yes stop_codon:yes gene_type:complete